MDINTLMAMLSDQQRPPVAQTAKVDTGALISELSRRAREERIRKEEEERKKADRKPTSSASITLNRIEYPSSYYRM